MVKIEINGQVVEAHEGDMLIDVADQAQISIPRFCYHKKLSIAGSCRMCLVEVEGAWKPLPACATPVTDGMKVFTKSKKAIAAQKSVMEFLLINHPLDCPICDQGGECELQDVAMDYGDDISRFSEPKRILGDREVGPLIQTDMTRCIHCTRCVRFGQEVAGMMELGATGRSEFVQIGTYIEGAITSEMSGNMIDICPVGALTSKPFRYSARAWELDAHKSIAPHDSIGSHIIIHTKNGEVKRVVPGENESINEVWISDKDRFSYEAINHESRLSQPLIKKNGQWQSSDWETALSYVAEKLQSIDSEELGVLASSNSTLEELYLLKQLANGIACNNTDTRTRQVDFSVDKTGFFSKKMNLSFEEVEKQKSVLLVGSYLRQELPLLNHRVRKAQLAGATISMINPDAFDFNYDVKNMIADKDYVQVLSQAVAYAASLKNTTYDWLPSADATESVKVIVDNLIEIADSTIFVGQIAQTDMYYGLILKLSSVLAELTNSKLNVLPMTANEIGADLVNFVPENGKNVQEMINSNLTAYINFGLEVEHDVFNGDAAVKAMQNAQFVVNFTAFDSEIQREYADVLLPIATFAETAGTFVNALGNKQSFRPAATPVGESKPGWKVLRVLGNMLDIDGFDYTNSNEVFAQVGNDLPQIDFTQIETVTLERDLGETYQIIPMYSTDSMVRRSASLQSASALTSN